MHMKIETPQSARDSLSTMFISMFIDFIHHLFMEEEEVQMMVKELLCADSSQRTLLVTEKLINTCSLHISYQFYLQKPSLKWLNSASKTQAIQNEHI